MKNNTHFWTGFSFILIELISSLIAAMFYFGVTMNAIFVVVIGFGFFVLNIVALGMMLKSI